MVKRIFSILVLVMPVLALAQSRDTVFTVKAAPSVVKLLPETNTLYQDLSKRFRLVKSSTVVIDTVIFEGGTVQVKDSLIILKPTKSKTVLLKIYEKQPGGRSALALVKEFYVQKFIEPKPNVDGVNCDSAIHRMKVVAQGYVNVPIRPDKELKRISYKVLSFEMESASNGKINTLKTNGNRMNFEMKDVIDKMGDGGAFQVNNIKYLVQEDTFTIQQPLRVYIINDTINKF